MSSPIRILLIEDHAGYRETIAAALTPEHDLELVEAFGTAEIALRSMRDWAGPAPDVLLLDLHLPGMSGIEALRWIREYSPSTEVIVLTQSDNSAEVRQALQEGASGYLLKSATLQQILEGIRTVQKGGTPLDPEVARYLLDAFRRQSQESPPERSLSDRELEILHLLGEGLAKKEIANRLGIGVTTVAYHVKHIYEKLDVANAPAAISKAFRTGILPPN